MKNFFYKTGITGTAVAGIIALMLVALFIEPFLVFWLAYFCGWLAKIIIGKYLVAGFALFGLVIPLEKIPLAAGILGWVGTFFKNSTARIKTNVD